MANRDWSLWQNLGCNLSLKILNPPFPELILQEHRFPESRIMFLTSILNECGTLFSLEERSSRQTTYLVIPNHDVVKEDKTISFQ